ncbi:MAG TPA: zinc-dependent alcohol dehydrogenase family protein [Atribacteraceae bacterium]|nr:zinc-dependent alcohol dehydrogenase family protein [Atribacteraceae bacterium]
MRACIFTGKDQWTIGEVDVPIPASDEVLIQVKAAGFCGTDLHILKGEYFSSFPIVTGHEFSGEVADVGKEVVGFQPGDRVAADPNIFCDRCYYCKINKHIHCENLRVVGVTQGGAFAEYVAVPEKAVYHLPDSTSYREGAMAEPLACVVYGVQRAKPRPGSKILIFGAGPIGLLMLALLRMSGAAQAVAVDISRAKLAMAAELGAETVVADGSEEETLRQLSSRGYDLVVDATGLPAVMERALPLVEPDGTFLVFGVAPIGASMRLEPYDIFRRDLRIIGSFALNKTMQYSLNLLAENRIPVGRYISASYSLEHFGEAFREVTENPDHLKVQIEF